MKKFNWPIWAGFLLTLISGFSFLFFFINFPVTRDFPWVNLLLFAIALALIAVGSRRAFAVPHPAEPGAKRSILSKILASVLATLSVLMIGLFVFSVFVASRWLPPSTGAPQVGQKAPEFTLSDMSGKQVSLSELVAAPIPGQTNAKKGVLLIFYRGYW
jgi:flagellar biosynthesis component FlhA